MFQDYADPLAFPGHRAPGYDPLHPASTPNIRLSCAATGNSSGGMIRLDQAQKCSQGTTVSVMTAYGPAANANTSTQRVRFAAPQLETPTAMTCAAIMAPLTTNGGFLLMNSDGSGATGQAGLQLSTTTFTLNMTIQGGNHISTVAAALNVPFFVAASFSNGNPIRYVATNLLTGQIQSQTLANSSSLGATLIAFYSIAGYYNAAAHVNQMTAMMSYDALSMGALLAWAADPWAFWYPRTGELQQVGRSLSGGFGSAALMIGV